MNIKKKKLPLNELSCSKVRITSPCKRDHLALYERLGVSVFASRVGCPPHLAAGWQQARYSDRGSFQFPTEGVRPSATKFTFHPRSGTKKKQRDGGRTATGRSRTVKLSPPPPRPLIRPLCRGVYPARESGLNYSRGNFGRKNKKKKRGGEAIARFHFTVEHSESYEPSQPITTLGT